MTELFEKIAQWGYDRGIVQNSTYDAQFKKLIEEVGELSKGLGEDDFNSTVDAIGDCTVVLTLLAEMIYKDHISKPGYPMIDCIEHAYNEIKDRTGHLNENGVFIKDGENDKNPTIEEQLNDWHDTWKPGDKPLPVKLRNGQRVWLTDVASDFNGALRGYVENKTSDCWYSNGKWDDEYSSQYDIVEILEGSDE